MVLKEFALLASDTARTKAYLQEMIRQNSLPGICIVYSDNIEQMKYEAENWGGGKNSGSTSYFCLKEPVFWTIKNAGISYVTVENRDINSIDMENCLRNITAKYIIYSGYGGYILKNHLFEMDKQFVHVHAGILPGYRGSTTFYYSWLQERMAGATAIFLAPGIDEGDIILQNNFPIPKDEVDIDYVYEPYIRSKVLSQVLEMYKKEGTLRGEPQEKDGAVTYFIIHPLLKHIALLKKESGKYGEQ